MVMLLGKGLTTMRANWTLDVVVFMCDFGSANMYIFRSSWTSFAWASADMAMSKQYTASMSDSVLDASFIIMTRGEERITF